MASEGEVMPIWLREGGGTPGLATSASLGLCDRICPDHNRHCDAYGTGERHNLGHPGSHACVFCDEWRQR